MRKKRRIETGLHILCCRRRLPGIGPGPGANVRPARPAHSRRRCLCLRCLSSGPGRHFSLTPPRTALKGPVGRTQDVIIASPEAGFVTRVGFCWRITYLLLSARLLGADARLRAWFDCFATLGEDHAGLIHEHRIDAVAQEIGLATGSRHQRAGGRGGHRAINRPDAVKSGVILCTGGGRGRGRAAGEHATKLPERKAASQCPRDGADKELVLRRRELSDSAPLPAARIAAALTAHVAHGRARIHARATHDGCLTRTATAA